MTKKRAYKQTGRKSVGGKGKFAPKLTHEERCGLYYASKIGVEDWILYKIANIHRSSLTRLLDGHSAYKYVHQEYEELGEEKFGERYYSEWLQEKITATRAEAQAAAPPAGPTVSQVQR